MRRDFDGDFNKCYEASAVPINGIAKFWGIRFASKTTVSSIRISDDGDVVNWAATAELTGMGLKGITCQTLPLEPSRGQVRASETLLVQEPILG